MWPQQVATTHDPRPPVSLSSGLSPVDGLHCRVPCNVCVRKTRCPSSLHGFVFRGGVKTPGRTRHINDKLRYDGTRTSMTSPRASGSSVGPRKGTSHRVVTGRRRSRGCDSVLLGLFPSVRRRKGCPGSGVRYHLSMGV